jgi:hypothetical protein
VACNVASLDAAPLPTDMAVMKSIVVDTPVQVRWGGWRGGGWGYRGFGGWGAGALAGAIIGGAIASSAYGRVAAVDIAASYVTDLQAKLVIWMVGLSPCRPDRGIQSDHQNR